MESSSEAAPVDENANAIEVPVPEHLTTQLQEIITEIEQNVVPEDEFEVTKEQEDAVKSLVEQELKLMQEEEALLAQQQMQEEEVKTKIAEKVELEASMMKAEELKAMEVEQGGKSSGANEMWNVEGVKVTFPHETEEGYYEEYDENGQPLAHTWKPKGKYEIIKTAVKHEDINAIRVADPKLSELQKIAVAQQLSTVPEDHAVQNDMQGGTQSMINGFEDELAGFNLPAGIPLLARILPKDPAEVERKISLERLFTPATDSPDLTPTRNKKVFSSSAFYRPDHPTIEDQVDLATRISQSLIQDDNRTSRGQTMYMKRKKRSVRWIHQGPHGPGLVEFSDPSGPDSPQRTPGERPTSLPIMPTLQPVKKDSTPSMPVTVPVPEMPTLRPVQDRGPMKLMMSSKQQQVDQVYQTSEMESPTGKGAALFAKRKKRMDNYIVDETTVQKSQETAFAHQQTSVMSSSSSAQSSSSMTTQGQQIMVGGALTGPTNITYGTQGAASGADVIYTAECKVVTRSHPPTPQFELPASGTALGYLTDDKHDKRKSFNLAAKGFGTYQNFYTPVHLGKVF